MNRDNINIFALLGSAVLLVAVIATAVLLDKAGIGVEDIPKWDDIIENRAEETTDAANTDKKDPEGSKSDEKVDSETDKDKEPSKNDKTESGDKDTVNSGTAAVGKPSLDKPEKDTDKAEDSKKPEETKKPLQNNSSDKKDPPESGDTSADTDESTDTDADTDVGDKSEGPELISYADYMEMTADEQQEYFNSFPDIQAYFDWYNDALAEYEAEQDRIEIGGGSVDMGDISNGGGN